MVGEEYRRMQEEGERFVRLTRESQQYRGLHIEHG